MTKAYVGSTEGTKAYLGDELVWGGEPRPVSRLPEGYIEVEYIENPSNAYINTGIKGKTGLKVTYKAYIPTANINAGIVTICGSRNNSSNTRLYLPTIYQKKWDLAIQTDTLSSYTVTGNAIYDIVVDMTTSTKKLYVNGAEVVSTTKSQTTSYNMYIFASNNYGNINQSNAEGLKIYGDFCIYDSNNTLLLQFVPCIDSNNVAGMYDLVSDTFNVSPNGTLFTAGNIVK